MKTHTIWTRRPVEVNTDPQRRCYNGCHAKSRMEWTDWADLFDVSSEEDGEESIRTFQSINPSHEYVLTPIGVQPERERQV